MNGPEWLNRFHACQDSLLADLEILVNHESPSRDRQALARLCAWLSTRLSRLGASVEVHPGTDGGDHVLARFAGRSSEPPALILGHYDTVWPLGTLERIPFAIAGGRARGPGVLDMKAGLALILAVMEVFREDSSLPARPVWILITSDEEVGSPGSRAVIERVASQCALALVLEPALAGGGLKTARKGVGRFRLDIAGRAAHAGVDPSAGRSAIVELARRILALGEIEDRPLGTTINVGVVAGGTTTNVVPASAWAEVDARVATTREQERVTSAFHAIRPLTPDVEVVVSGGFSRPPMERTPAIAALFDQARLLGRTIGLELTEGSTGGGSDGNFTAALGIPTLDGLGATGGGAHADDEHVVIASLPERAALLALLIEGLKQP